LMYNDDRLSSFGIEPVTAYQYVHDRNMIPFSYVVLQYIIGKGDYPEVLRYLYLLRIEGETAKSARPAQEECGHLLAENDFRRDPSGNPEANLAAICGEDTWYLYFRKSYLSEWKNLTGK
jgi:hypothetical protein